MRVLGFFDSGRRIAVGIAGFVAAVVSLWATVVPLIWGKPSATPTPTPAAAVSSSADDPQIRAAQVRACEERHQMSQAQQRFTTSDYSFSFRFCQWPPPPYADGDGFYEIVVATVEGPGAYEALGTTLVDRIHGPCGVFRLAYDFGKMGGSEHLSPFQARPEELLFGGDGNPYQGSKSELSFYPGRDEVDLLHNGSYQLFTASCDS